MANFSVKTFILILGLSLISFIDKTNYSLILIFGIATIWALKGPWETIQSYFISIFLILGNPAVFSGPSAVMRWLVLAAGFATSIRIITSYRGYSFKAIKTLILFLSVAIFCTILSSNIALISSLKLFSFFLSVFSILVCFQSLTKSKDEIIRWVNSYFLAVLFLSVIAVPAGIGYLRTHEGFQGILLHPQSFGAFMAIAASWFLGLAFMRDQPPVSNIILALLSAGFLFLSSSRTAAGSFILGFGFCFSIYHIFFVSRASQSRLFQYSPWIVIFSIIAIVSAPLFLRDMMIEFVAKSDVSETSETFLLRELEKSRGDLIANSWQGFKKSPITGNGLGLPWNIDKNFLEQRVEYLGDIPVSASVEKGFFITATLEEIGILGTAFFAIFILNIIRIIFRNTELQFVFIAIVAILTNLGEATFYSVGAFGWFLWMILGLGIWASTSPNDY